MEEAINLGLLADIATTLSALVAAGSLVAGFKLYKISQRDVYTAQLRTSIARSRNSFQKLGRLVTNYELTNEMVSCVVYSNDLDPVLNRIYKEFFAKSHQNNDSRNTLTTKERVRQLKEYTKKTINFPPITVPVRTPLYNMFEDITDKIEADIAQYQIDYPGLYRVLFSIVTVFKNILIINKNIAEDEEQWKDTLAWILEEDNPCYSVEHFKHFIAVTFISIISSKLQESDIEDIRDLLDMLDVVANAYLSKSEKKLMNLRARAQQISFKPISKLDNISEILEEAVKTIELLLNKDEMEKYRRFADRFEARNPKPEKHNV